MPNDWTPQPPYPFDAAGKIDTPSGRARRQLLKTALGTLIAAAAGYLGWTQLTTSAKVRNTRSGIGGTSNDQLRARVAVGSAAQLMKSPDPTLITVAGQQAFVEFVGGKPSALSAVCPHQACDVEWQAGPRKFVCPCHDSEFARDGSLLQGPAKEPLARLTSFVDNGTVYVAG